MNTIQTTAKPAGWIMKGKQAKREEETEEGKKKP